MTTTSVGTYGAARVTTTTDARGHATAVRTQTAGNRAFTWTVYPDGTGGETVTGAAGHLVNSSALSGQWFFPLPTPEEGWPGVPDDPTGMPPGDHLEVTLAQRGSGDPDVTSYHLYDADGRLTDVWVPPVIDADPTSPTYGLDPDDTDHYLVPVRPHWHYEYDQEKKRGRDSNNRFATPPA